MPKSTAIQLTKDTIQTISGALGVPEEMVVQEYVDSVLAKPGAEPVYYVTNVLYFYTVYPYMIYGRSDFLDDFASVPPGIEDRFVPVTQIKSSKP